MTVLKQHNCATRPVAMSPALASAAKTINVDDVDDWIVVKDDRSIEKGWGFSLFGKENEATFESAKRKRVDRLLMKHGYAKTRSDADDMIKDGRVCVGGAPVERESRVLLSALTVDGKAFVPVKRRAGTLDDDDDDDDE